MEKDTSLPSFSSPSFQAQVSTNTQSVSPSLPNPIHEPHGIKSELSLKDFFPKLPLLAENISNADRLSQLQLQVEFLASKLHDTLALIHSEKAKSLNSIPSTEDEHEKINKFIDQAPNDFITSTETIFQLVDTLPPQPSTLENALPILQSHSSELRRNVNELANTIKAGEQLLSVIRQTRLDILNQEAEKLRTIKVSSTDLSLSSE